MRVSEGCAVRDLACEALDQLLALGQHLHLDDDPLHVQLGACSGARLAAASGAIVVANLTRGAKPYAVVENVVTHPGFCRRGYGRTVLSALLDRCCVHGRYKVTFTTGRSASPLHDFNESLGFDRRAKASVRDTPAVTWSAPVRMDGRT